MSEAQPNVYYPQYGLTRQQIIQRLAELRFNITTPVANIFAAVVPANHRRVVTQLQASNPNGSPTSFRLRRVLADTTTRAWMADVQVQALENYPVNQAGDPIGAPLIILTRGQNIDALRADAIDMEGTIQFFDIPRN